MAVGDRVTPQDVGRRWAEAVREEPAVRGLWALAHRDYIEVWLVTEPADMDTTRRLTEAGLELHDQFPDTYLRFYVLNARHYPDIDPATLIPQGAEVVPLHPE